MTGPKLNEGVLLLDEAQVSTKATARYLKGSATKARQVLDLIRGLDVRRADEVLQFTDRAAADDVRKVLASAVANAVHNESQDADELFVVACFADEGPTLKRFRPRARGRASRIRKRTCHITVIVARMSEARLEIVQARQASGSAAGRRPGTSAQSRRDRVARSRARAEGLRAGTTAADGETPDELADDADAIADDTDADALADADAIETDEVAAADDTAADDTAADDTAADDTAADDTVDEEAEDGDTAAAEAEGADDGVEAVDGAQDPASAEAPETDASADANLPPGAVAAPEDGSVPEGYEIKSNATSSKFHIPGGRYYDITAADLYFDTVESAEAAGFEAPAADADAVHGEGADSESQSDEEAN